MTTRSASPLYTAHAEATSSLCHQVLRLATLSLTVCDAADCNSLHKTTVFYNKGALICALKKLAPSSSDIDVENVLAAFFPTSDKMAPRAASPSSPTFLEYFESELSALVDYFSLASRTLPEESAFVGAFAPLVEQWPEASPYDVVTHLQSSLPQMEECERKLIFFATQQDAGGVKGLLQFIYQRIVEAARLLMCNEFLKNPAGNHAEEQDTLLYVMLQDRCQDKSPALRWKVAINCSLSEGHRLMECAEGALTRGSLGSAWDDAAVLFDRAAAYLACESYYTTAANALVRCSDCRRFLQDKEGEAQYLVNAAQDYALGGTLEACARAIETAMCVFKESKRTAKLAKVGKWLADVYLALDDPHAAVDVLRRAASVFLELSLTSEAVCCLKKAANLTVTRLLDLDLAVELLELLADVTPESGKALVAMEALLCMLVRLPPELGADFRDGLADAEAKYSEYCDAFPSFVKSAERVMLRKTMDSLATTNSDNMEEAMGQYLVCRKTHLSKWVSEMMTEIHQNCVTKHLNVDKQFRIG